MRAPVLVLGSTDFTLAVAEAILATGTKIGAIVYVGETFKISYAKDGVKNYRHANIALWAREHGVRAIQYESVSKLSGEIQHESFSACVLAGWYHKVPADLRARFPRGCVGFHASLLPKLRGGAPLNWAILRDLKETGMSMFEVGDGVDDGPLFDQVSFPIGPRSYVSDLVAASCEAARTIVGRSFTAFLSGELAPNPQVGEPTRERQRRPEDGRVLWSSSAATIDRMVRAVSHPYPGAATTLSGRRLCIYRSEPVEVDLELQGSEGRIAGVTLAGMPFVECGEGWLLIQEAAFDDGADAIPFIVSNIEQRLGS